MRHTPTRPLRRRRIFRRLVNGIYQHYVEGAAPKVLKQVAGLLRARREAVMPRDVVALWLPDAGAAADPDPDIGRSGSFAAGCDAPRGPARGGSAVHLVP